MTRVERRVRPLGIELRARGEGEMPVIAGRAVVYGVESEDLGGFVEVVMPGALTRAIETSDPRALWNHDVNYVLGRASTKTLRLADGAAGLEYEIDPPNTTWARDLVAVMRRGDVSGSSFGFVVGKDDWSLLPDYRILRKIIEIDELWDVSPVTYPAFTQTESEVRSRRDILNEARERVSALRDWQADLDIRRRLLGLRAR